MITELLSDTFEKNVRLVAKAPYLPPEQGYRISV